MHRVSAALAGLIIIVSAGCGTAQATATGHTAPPCPRADNVITQADSGKTYCVRAGGQVSIILHSTQKNLWRVPLASGHVLKAVPNGAGSLVAGATGIWYKATRPGRSVVTSVRPPCRAAANSAGTAYPVKSCAPKDRFTVTIIAS
jgi:putative hemolysin